jgi:zinc transporter
METLPQSGKPVRAPAAGGVIDRPAATDDHATQRNETSAESGLVHAFLFDKGVAVQELDADEAIAWLKRRDGTDGQFIWLHFHDTERVLHDWPARLLKLPAAFTDTLKEGARSTRIAYDSRGLTAVLNDVDYGGAGRKEPLTVATLWLYVGPRYLLSVRSLALRSVDKLRADVQAGETFETAMALLVRLLQDQEDVLAAMTRTAAEHSNRVEAILFADRLPKRTGLGAIRRELVRLRRLLAPEPAALFRLVNRPPHWMRDEDVQLLRQSAEEFALTLRDIEGLQERIKLLEEEIANKVGEHTNRSVLVLTAVTVIALPVNLLSGLFGMNIGGMPWQHDNAGFAIVLLVSLVLTSLCAWLILRLARD